MLNARHDADMRREHAVILSALYLRGLSRAVQPPVRLWPHVMAVLERFEVELDQAPQALMAHGFEAESVCLHDGGLIDRATEVVFGRRCLTAAHPKFPTRWSERLGAKALPALWWNGFPFSARRCVTFVGSRQPGGPALERVVAMAQSAAELGYSIISGGAVGCDRASVRGARLAESGREGGTLEIVPYGLSFVEIEGRAVLSACAPDAGFTSGQAMERNMLLYAASPVSIIGHSRFREGGTWIGATTALRHRHSRVVLAPWGEDAAFRALLALGAQPFGGGFEAGLYDAELQTPLFETPQAPGWRVSEPRLAYAA